MGRPSNLSFTYAIEQAGAHLLSQSHHVFRAGPNERDETTIADGYVLRRPVVRIFRNRSDRYDIAAIAPRERGYTFKFTGTQHDGDHDDYLFDTSPRSARPFAVTSIAIDSVRFLPAEIDFHVASAALRGQGHLSYGRVDDYWLIREAEVSAHGKSGASSREHLIWSDYAFPDSLPASTFSSRTPSLSAPRRLRPSASPAPGPSSFAAPAATVPASAPPAAVETPVTKRAVPVPEPAATARAPVRRAQAHPNPAGAQNNGGAQAVETLLPLYITPAPEHPPAAPPVPASSGPQAPPP